MRDRRFHRRFMKSLKSRGFAGSMVHYAAISIGLIRLALRPHERLRQRELDLAFTRKRQEIDSKFDEYNNLDTGGRIELEELTLSSTNPDESNFYQAVFPETFGKCIERLNIDPREYVFIDIGAGKGRALFLAQDYNFKRVIGVELGKELVEVCKQNIARRNMDGVKRPRVEILWMDALKYSLPPEPTVLFLYNPFGAPLMNAMANSIEKSLIDLPRKVKIIYVNPLHDEEIIKNISNIKKTYCTDAFNIYDIYPEANKKIDAHNLDISGYAA